MATGPEPKAPPIGAGPAGTQCWISGPTISAGTSLSNSVQTAPAYQLKIQALVMPSAWDPAPITFQWSFDNAVWYDVFDRRGAEAALQISPNSIIPLASEFLPYTVPYLKIRSGPRIKPVNQTADRVFAVICQ